MTNPMPTMGEVKRDPARQGDTGLAIEFKEGTCYTHATKEDAADQIDFAENICRAVNAHDDLLFACKSGISALDQARVNVGFDCRGCGHACCGLCAMKAAVVKGEGRAT